MRLTISTILAVTILGISLFAVTVSTVQAQPSDGSGESAGAVSEEALNRFLGGSGYGDKQTAESTGAVIAQIIQTILSLTGVVFLILAVIAGLRWMLAGGNDEQVEKSKTQLRNAVIGFALTMFAFTITYMIVIFTGVSGGYDGSNLGPGAGFIQLLFSTSGL